MTIAPQQITDRDIAELRQHYQDVEVAETVYAVCTANFFNRFTETLQLK